MGGCIKPLGLLKGKPMSDRIITVVSGVIQRDNKYLITQRMEKAVLPLLWEFPGGRLEEGEAPEQALGRGCQVRSHRVWSQLGR